MKDRFTIILILIVIAGGAFIFYQSNNQTPPESKDQSVMVRITDKPQIQTDTGYTGELLAGTTTPYLAFTKSDYQKAKAEGKIIVLNFYATWCPICRAEKPAALAAFNSLNNESAIGFQINYNDPETDADEKALAAEFAVTYQHTKVIIRDGKEVFKETVQWSKQEFIDAVTNASK